MNLRTILKLTIEFTRNDDGTFSARTNDAEGFGNTIAEAAANVVESYDPDTP